MTQLTRDNQLVGPSEPSLVHLADGEAAAQPAIWSDLFQMTKPRIAMMVVITAYVGCVLGAPATGSGAPGSGAPGNSRDALGGLPWLALFAMLAGTALACGGAAVMNQIYERNTDARMRRTKDRPVPAGRIAPAPALAYGLTLAAAGLALLLFTNNLLCAALTLFTVLSYALIYTPMKRVSSTSTIIGAVPGAMPPVIGYAASAGHLDLTATVLFGIIFLWQLPHFLAIAWLYRDDYAKAGMPMLAVIDPSGASTFRQSLLGCLALVPMGLMPALLGVCGPIYFAGALFLGVAFLAFCVALVIGQSARHARAMFFASLVYLPGIFVLLLVDRI